MADKRVAKRSTAVTKYNIGTIILALFSVYIIINIFRFFSHSHLTIYEVQKLPLASNTKAEAVIIRNETPIKTGIAGYVNYYMRSGSRVSKGETIYSIDESRQIYNMLSEEDDDFSFSNEDIDSIKGIITNYSEQYNPNDYASMLTLRDELSTSISSIRDIYILEKLNQKLINSDYSGSLTVHKAETPGMISYFSDSLDGLKVENVSLKTFDKSNYKNTNLFDSNLKEQGSVIYKMLSDENWDLVLNLTEEQYNSLCDRSTLTYTIEEDNLQLTSPVIFFRYGDGYFARITLRQYMVRYINKRFLTISLDMNSNKSGLKIPKSSLVQKDFYMIPHQYFSKGADQQANQTGICILHHDDRDGQKYFEFVPTEIYYEDEDYKYIDVKALTYATYIYDNINQVEFQVSAVGKLTGVYCVNKGYAQFRRVEIEQDGDEFVIVKNGIPYSIAEHDHIADDSKTISELQTIY